MTEPMDPQRDTEPRRSLDEPMTDYPRSNPPTAEEAPRGKGTVQFLGMELAIFPTVTLLAVVFLAVIIYFATTR